MRTDMGINRPLAAAAIFLSLIVILGPIGSASAKENMPVTCYKDGSRIGTVTVFDWKAAAATCNTVLHDCEGECVGCFRDFDYVNDVCIDTKGHVFLR